VASHSTEPYGSKLLIVDRQGRRNGTLPATDFNDAMTMMRLVTEMAADSNRFCQYAKLQRAYVTKTAAPPAYRIWTAADKNSSTACHQC